MKMLDLSNTLKSVMLDISGIPESGMLDISKSRLMFSIMTSSSNSDTLCRMNA